MPSMNFYVAAVAAVSAGTALAMVDPYPGGNLNPCHGQTCDDCENLQYSLNEGYPNCIIYDSASQLGSSFSADSGNGYRVWWDSGTANAGCKIIVRTPASTDLPACGYFLRDWHDEGCYYTSLDESFNLQYCCGGDCASAEPSTSKRSSEPEYQPLSASSIEEVNLNHLKGLSSMTNLILPDFSKSEGTEDVGSLGTVKWAKRDASAPSQLAKKALHEADELEAGTRSHALEVRDGSCNTYTENKRYTDGIGQFKVSPTQKCNSSGGCSIAVDTTVTTGRTASVSVGFDLFELFTASTQIQFTKSKSRSITTTFTQDEGTTGYVTFIPTYICTSGPLSGCHGSDASNGEVVNGCEPQTLSNGQQDGTYSFVYT